VDKIGASSVKILWDPANAVFADERPFPGGYEAVKAQMAHVHVKDAARTAKGDVECVVVGKGAVDWPAHLRALKSDGYQGYLSLETHYNGLGDKEPSSRLCLERLIRMVEGLE
jgi:sugar phosphate isomerase/epimerase